MPDATPCPDCTESGESPGVIVGRGYCRKHYLRRWKRNEFADYRRPGPVPTDRRCSVADCARPHKALGLCRLHLNRARRAGEIDALPACAFDGCDNPSHAHDLCLAHSRQYRKGQELRPLRARTSRDGWCPGPECGLPIRAGGYCGGHYYQAKAGRPLTPIMRDGVPRGSECAVDGCDRPSLTRDGICRTHYRYRQAGDEDWQRPIPDKAPDGEGHLNPDGYRIVTVDGRPKREHHVFAERLLGRPLVGVENVHHVNGDRADNRTDGPFVMDERGRLRSGNLEVWVTAQPAGQEIGPRVDRALDLLETYAEFLLPGQRARLVALAGGLS